MSNKKVYFQNNDGLKLAALLELPTNQEPHNYAIFAHCFTCNKNLIAVKNICRALNNKGIAVLRFDFTGLGESDGDFEDTNFSSNIRDLSAAARYLTNNYKSPSILIGHSLGGAATLFAGKVIESIKAIATIGAPSSPSHVKHLFKSSIDEINKTGIANVSIGGRPFTVKKKFIDDITSKNTENTIKQLRKPLLVLHSPQDKIVGIENAQEIYSYAHHPKSFISLNGADHLLSNKKDSTYVGNVIAGWVERYITIPKKEVIRSNHQVVVSIGNDHYTSEVAAGNHFLVADEPEELGGNNYGPSPYELVSAGLGACTVITLRMYADRKNWDLEKVIVHINHYKDFESSSSKKKVDFFDRKIEFYGGLNQVEREKLLSIADKCPVHKTLSSKSLIKTELVN